MRSTQQVCVLTALALSTLLLAGSAYSLESLSLDQILDQAYQREQAFQEQLKDYICQATCTILEPHKDGTAKTLSIEEKTIYRKPPDKRMEKYTAVTEEGKALSPEEVLEYQKKQKKTTMGSRSFFSPEQRANYTYELLSPDTVKGLHTFVLRIKPSKKEKNLVDGKIWLHAKNFEVLKLDFKPAKNPKFVKEVNMIMSFDEIQPGLWLPSELKIDVHAGFLFIKKHLNVRETWYDYQINVGLPDSLFSEEE